MISIAYRTGRIIKWLKGTKRFCCMMTELDMSNSTMCFKINMYKLLKKPGQKIQHYNYNILKTILN